MNEQVTEVKKLRGYYLVCLDSGDAFKVPPPVIRAFPLKAGDKVHAEPYFAACIKETKRFASERAAFLLERKDYPAKQLHEKLTMVGYPESIADEVLYFLLSRGYIDDKRYAKRFVEKKMGKTGASRIRQELLMRGISKEDIDEALQELIDMDDQLHAAIAHVEKYKKTRKQYDPMKLRNNAIAMLARRGFSFEIAKKAFDMALQSDE